MGEPRKKPNAPLLKVLHGQKQTKPPVWLMRQAGRYLPEYRALRQKKAGFLNLVEDSEAAAEVTLQPVRRFGFDAAILFSDILVIPYALGQNLTFVKGEGPKLTPPLVNHTLKTLERAPQHLKAIYATVRRVADVLAPETTFLGFCGSPWTVATYMVAGEGSRDQAVTREMAYRDPQAFSEIIDAIIDSSVDYLNGQIEAGVDAVQLFDSWAGPLSPQQFERWVIAPTAKLISRLREKQPHIPIIGFPKGAGSRIKAYVCDTQVNAIGLDETVDPLWAHQYLPSDLPIQGNLDPLALLVGGDALDQAIKTILDAFSERPHIFNLGHGILPQTPLNHVSRLLEILRA
ncbi:MAG: uroporphyrinogen decarboxylase [Zymomonas mobilis subsp. pomaceae]|uniref:Uroporphyrinogen decarboxylase n=1 Tax=Zymomonas mobilis subsp. pomaceae (strain ATCC 29192 / DSM 22645 / JCM 10191 / CCUG 17912 / NBRC 13757 / NCIMB 11200 / NRRL B-4491 / Barker I) TaxID=579138 RepID=F8ETW2_ZYMMT|nr:uroporphyrinogen decarboxylase [Zymomonas mobilis]AEI38059.1 uroporphyrinogen decarboxylase [Zymomonas mobilis subsp. pomaceae ATCC 29192]MDX5949426.1 uroporphyrinogen decarboxylase [Zymomonas mobilis subsp. pomaceae]GEB89169.1 uroporphyrinogen decarboxylase [Zymomonas mobilis subsp. pomaceae]